jgi:GMP synthase-like glutamine amidotransferase
VTRVAGLGEMELTEHKKLRVGILETGRPPEELGGQYGDYPEMVRKWLAPLEAEFTSYAVLDGEMPDGPESCDLWVITGSKYAVYESHPWIAPLEAFVRSVRDAGRKMIGICFGHQIIAQALGGAVRKSGKGWGLGVHEYATDDWPDELGEKPEKIAIQSYHQDQVEALPEGAKRIATSDFCENAALWYPGFALTVQGHPEFSTPYVNVLLDLRRGSILSDEDVAQGKRNLKRQAKPKALADLIREKLDKI